MSTLSGVTQKGEKGKPRFQSLDINNLYNQTSRGESSEPHQQKSTQHRRHGMQTLGKVPSTRRPPANLPSLKSEHSGNDPSVSLVPSGGTGWGSKPGETGPSPAPQPTSQATTPTPASTVTQTHGSSAPAAAGIGMPAAPTNIAPPQPPVAQQPPPMMKPIIGNTSSGDKTWSSVTCGDSGPSFLAHQSPQFQQEFPSLSGEGGAQAPPGGTGGGGGGKGPGVGADLQYGPGPSLRPQTEGSWITGGVARGVGTSGPPVLTPPSHPPQHPYLPQEIVGGSQSGGAPRSNLAPFGAGGVPGGLTSSGSSLPPTSAAPPIPSQFRNVLPEFLQKSSGFSGFPPPTSTSSSNFQNNIRPTRFNPPDMNRFNPSRHADPEDLIPRPIIREEDLTRMDEISRDSSWAANNDIDYNQKIAFSDDESTGVDDDKETIKEKNKDSERKEQNRIAMDSDRDSKPSDRLGPNENKQIWAGRGPGAGPVDFRQFSGPPHTMVSEHEDDLWSEKRRQTSENIKQFTEKAIQRKEEVVKKFEESRCKTSIDNDKIKGKKDDGSDMLHHNTSLMSDWNKDDMGKGGLMSHPPPPSKDSMNESSGNNLRQTAQNESRNDMMRDRFRGDTGRNFHHSPAPRFQNKQMGSQQVRQPPSNAYDGGGGRWSNQNSHAGSGPMNFLIKGPVGGRRGQGEAGDLQESDRFLHKDDKMGRNHNDERDRYRPNARDGAHESNRKNNYYDGPTDYNRHHRDFDHNNRERNKDSDYRQRDRDELEWEGRRGNNASWDKQYDDKSQGRRDHKKPNDSFHKSQTQFGDDRDLERPQRPESRDRPDRPPRPDSRDSRTSRDSRNSRDSIREDSKSIPESNDFSWGLGDYDKESKNDKPRKKDSSKDDKRDGPRREGHVPGPITKEKIVAYEIKQQLSKTEKKEIISSTLINSVPEEDTRNKLAPLAPQLPASASDSWSENVDTGSAPGSMVKEDSPPAMSLVQASDDAADKSPKDDQSFDKKKDGGSLKDKEGKNGRGGRGSRPGGGRQGERPYNPNSSNSYYQRNASGPSPYPRDNNRRRGQGKGVLKDKRDFGSDSDGSLDEVSVSTESGKEDKKSDRRQLPRSSRSGERKKDKDERNNRETKKIDNEKGLSSRKHGYESVRKEGFAPRGEPSRRGRGSFRTGGRGSLLNVGGHYGPPGSKSPFPPSSSQHLDNKSQEEDDKLSEKPLDMDHLLSGDADKSKHKSQHQGNITGGNRLPKESRKSDVVIKGKMMRSKGGSGEERDSTSDAGSDSDTKKPPRNMQKTDKNKSNQRAAGEKRLPYNTAHMNGRPSRSDDGKDNGFQEVKGKKMVKESRPLSRGRKDGKGKNGSGGPGNGSGIQPKNNNSSKPFQRESCWSSNKPPRLQKLDNVRKQQQQLAQQQDVSEMNKINQNVVPLFPSSIRDVNCSMTPAPPPTKSAWEKPITAALRAISPTLHLSSSIGNPSEKPGMEILDHVQSGTSSQTSSPSAEKVMVAKLSRETMDKGMLDGANPPKKTIIFENTNFKTPELPIKTKYGLKPPRIDKGRGKLDEELEGATHGIGSLSFKTGVDLKSCDNKPQESLQMQMTYKNEDNADMKLDFQFDSDFATDDKTNIPRSNIHLGQSSAELGQKIASVKKVWDAVGSTMEHQHHVDEVHVVSTSSSSFTPNFVGSVDSGLDHPSTHQVDDNTFNNADVYSPGMQGVGAGYAASAAAMMKQDPSNTVSGVKTQPQQAAVMSTAIGAHSGSLSSPPPPFNQPGPFAYQAPYSSMPPVPSPPAVMMNPQGAQVAASTQDYVQGHPYQFSSQMINSQTQRSSFSQHNTYNPYRQSQSLSGGLTTFQPPGSVFIQPPQAGNAPPELFPPYSLTSYGQSPQMSNNPSAVLIAPSNSNSLMSASVKSSPQQPHGAPALGAIGSKASFQNSQIPMGFMSYEPKLITNFLPASQLVTQRHGGSNVPPSTSFYSGSSAGAPTAFSSLLGTNSQTMHTAATAFSMQNYSNQSAANQGAAPPSSNVGHPSFSPMTHFRSTPQSYMKPGGPGQHQPDASKSPSTNQDCLSNSVFSTSGNGNQIPSPKSRSAGGPNSGGKQVSVSPQQPSPTQSHHKFPTYPQQNMVGHPPPNSQAGPQRSGSQLGGTVRSNNGSNGASSLNNSGHLKYSPAPIQRPGPNSYQQQQQVMNSYVPQQQQQQQQQQPHQRHGRQQQCLGGRLTQQPHVKSNYYIQQGNPVKLETGIEVKGDQDKFMDKSNSAKPDKKEEVTNSVEQ